MKRYLAQIGRETYLLREDYEENMIWYVGDQGITENESHLPENDDELRNVLWNVEWVDGDIHKYGYDISIEEITNPDFHL